MPDFIGVAPSNLLVDPENPRLSEPSQGQRQIERAMAAHQKRKLLMLARDIVANGLNPSDLPIIMNAGDDLKRYMVLEGNRRIVALKALENPDLMAGALDASSLNELRAISKKYLEAPIDTVQCVVVKDRKEAEHWIILRHTGENEGAGIVRWGTDEQARYKARAGARPISTQALDILEEQNLITASDRSKVPLASLKRLLSTPEVRDKIGLDLEDGKLTQVKESGGNFTIF